MTTDAALPAPSAAAIGGSPAVIRSVGKCIVLTIASFGLWAFAWIYHTADEVSPAAGEQASTAGRFRAPGQWAGRAAGGYRESPHGAGVTLPRGGATPREWPGPGDRFSAKRADLLAVTI